MLWIKSGILAKFQMIYPENPYYGEDSIYEDKCYASCKAANPTEIEWEFKYYRKNDNKNIKECKINENIYKYSIGNNVESIKKYICYSFYKDISEEYIYESGYMCYSQTIDLSTDKS